jgi:hypothetical protein
MAGIDDAGRGRGADLLGRYDPRFPERQDGASAFDSWAALASRAGGYTGDFAYRCDGNVGGARDAFAVSAGWDGAVGHGPAPGS